MKAPFWLHRSVLQVISSSLTLCLTCHAQLKYGEDYRETSRSFQIKLKAHNCQGLEEGGWERQREETIVLFPLSAAPQFQKPLHFKVRMQFFKCLCCCSAFSACDMRSYTVVMQPKAWILMQTLVLGSGFLQLT